MPDVSKAHSDETPSPVAKQRLLSLDALRGFDMFWIIGGAGLFPALFTLTGGRPDARHGRSLSPGQCPWRASYRCVIDGSMIDCPDNTGTKCTRIEFNTQTLASR